MLKLKLQLTWYKLFRIWVQMTVNLNGLALMTVSMISTHRGYYGQQ